MNWGHKITIVIIAFMAFIIFLVIKTTLVTIDLEAEDYYQQEVNYQGRINAIHNGKGLASEWRLEQTKESIKLISPKSLRGMELEGYVTFFRANNSKLDRKFTIDFSPLGQAIDQQQLVSGRYKMKISWRQGSKDYYVEKNVLIKAY